MFPCLVFFPSRNSFFLFLGVSEEGIWIFLQHGNKCFKKIPSHCNISKAGRGGKGKINGLHGWRESELLKFAHHVHGPATDVCRCERETKREHGKYAWVKQRHRAGKQTLADCGCFYGWDLAAAIDRLQWWRCGLPLQSEEHVARPVCTREQQQRPASLGHRTSAAHTHAHMQGFTFDHHMQACGQVIHRVSYISCEGQTHTEPVNGNWFF